MKKQNNSSNNKSNMVTFRINDKAAEELDLIKTIIQKQRGPGASNVTRTEVIQILLELGTQEYLSKNK